MDILDSITTYRDSLLQNPELSAKNKIVIDQLTRILQDRIVPSISDPLSFIEIILKRNDLLRTDCLSFDNLIHVKNFIAYLKTIPVLMKIKGLLEPLILLEKIDQDGKIIGEELDYTAFNQVTAFDSIRNFLKPVDSFFYDFGTNELLLKPKQNGKPVEIFCKGRIEDPSDYQCNCGLGEFNASFPSLLRKMT